MTKEKNTTKSQRTAAPLRVYTAPAPAACAPTVRGGQGRTAESVIADAWIVVASMIGLGISGCVLGW